MNNYHFWALWNLILCFGANNPWVMIIAFIFAITSLFIAEYKNWREK